MQSSGYENHSYAQYQCAQRHMLLRRSAVQALGLRAAAAAAALRASPASPVRRRVAFMRAMQFATGTRQQSQAVPPARARLLLLLDSRQTHPIRPCGYFSPPCVWSMLYYAQQHAQHAQPCGKYVTQPISCPQVLPAAGLSASTAALAAQLCSPVLWHSEQVRCVLHGMHSPTRHR